MKTDNYLTLCLEQAAKSPLHYRHGCVVVRGGKVIGQGYNDYKPGFNGGALKHGRIASGAYDGAVIAELKQKRKQKQKAKPEPDHDTTNKKFTPFEGTGGGHHASVPLSMHSEMMAIHSALAASSTLSSTAFACEKPCFKLPGHSKRKARLRQQVLRQYVEHMCATSERSGKAQVGPDRNTSNEEDEEPRREKELCRAFHTPLGGLKHQKRKEKEKNHRAEDQCEYQTAHICRFDRSGQQIQPQQLRQQRSVFKRLENDGRLTHHNSTISADSMTQRSAAHAEKGNTPVCKTIWVRKKRELIHPKPPQPELMLLPTGRTGQASSVNERKKHPRLAGADLYVARLGWCNDPNKPTPKPLTIVAAPATVTPIITSDEVADHDCSDRGSLTPSFTPTRSSSTGSLHDELTNPLPSTPPIIASAGDNSSVGRREIHASRPCYRCISYMHSAGIKRVFWTNDNGDWEGSKVRDLVDALEISTEAARNGDAGGPVGNGMFVTKHEVLMLKRLMREGG